MKKINIGSIVPALVLFVILGLAGSTLVRASSPATVNLGTAGNYVILSKTTITTTGTTAIVGDIGVSPAAATFVTGFNPTADSTNTFSTSALINGKIFASDYSAPTPANLSTAISDMETAYTAANSRATSVLNAGAGNLAGLSLVAGVYTFDGAGNVIITGDVTLTGSASDVWVFQVPGNLDISAGIKVLLSGGAQASNIFWAVAGTTTVEPGATFEGNILAGPGASTIALQSGAILNGRALGQTAVTLIGNAITIPTLVNPPSSGPVFIDTNVNGTLDQGEQFFNTIQDAVNAASPTGDTIVITQNLTTTSETTINKSVTIDGKGFTLHANFVKTDNSNNSALGIGADNVTIKNLIEDGTGSTNLHGINIYQSTGVVLDTVTVSHNGHAGVIVNGSSVTTNNITTINNTWYGIDVDQGSGVTLPSNLTVSGTSTHTETSPAILIDNITKNVSVTDTNNQYEFFANGNVRVYNLKSTNNQTLDLGTFTGGAGTTTNAVIMDTEDLDVVIPQGVLITSEDTNWDGVINMPTAVTAPAITADSGMTASAVMSLEVGDGDILLSFNQPVKLIFAGQADNLVGSSRAGVFTPITATCDSLTAPTLSAGADCKIVSGLDLVVWTRHFTTFVTYTQTTISAPAPTPVPTGAISGGGGGGMAVYTGPNTQVATGGEVLGASVDPATQAQINSVKYQMRNVIIELINQLQLQVRAMQIEDIKSQLRTLIGQLIVQIQDQIRVMQMSY